MSNYANDNGTGLEQQVMINLQHPECILVAKSVNENFFILAGSESKKNQTWQQR